MPTPKTPYGVTVETPLSASSSIPIDPPEHEPEPESEQSRPPASLVLTGSGPSRPSIRLRYKGYTIQDIDKIRQAAHELDQNDDYENAYNKYCELLDVLKHLLPVAKEGYRSLVYEAACFFARNEDMEKADKVLDRLSEECIQWWGAVHEQTLKHYAKIGKLLAQWDRHRDAVDIFKRITDNFPVLAISTQEVPGQRPTSQPRTLHSYVDVDNQPLQDSINIVLGEHVEESPSLALTMLQEQLSLNHSLDVDEQKSLDRVILDILENMEENPTENATGILHAHCLLVTFYNKAEMPDDSVAALDKAKDRALSICKLNFNLTTTFFHTAIDLAKTLFEEKQQTAADDLLDRLQERFTDDYGYEHTDTILLLIRIGKMFQRLKRWDLARPRFQAAFAGAIDRFGLDSQLAKRLEACLEDNHYPFEAGPNDESVFIPIVTL
jgi:hypothetical protein